MQPVLFNIAQDFYNIFILPTLVFLMWNNCCEVLQKDPYFLGTSPSMVSLSWMFSVGTFHKKVKTAVHLSTKKKTKHQNQKPNKPKNQQTKKPTKKVVFNTCCWRIIKSRPSAWVKRAASFTAQVCSWSNVVFQDKRPKMQVLKCSLEVSPSFCSDSHSICFISLVLRGVLITICLWRRMWSSKV